MYGILGHLKDNPDFDPLCNNKTLGEDIVAREMNHIFEHIQGHIDSNRGIL